MNGSSTGTREAPTPTAHADLRWIQYADVDADMQQAWAEALPLVDHALTGDEARYCPTHDVVIVRKGAAFTTVINNDASIRWQARRAIHRAVDRFGTDPLPRERP